MTPDDNAKPASKAGRRFLTIIAALLVLLILVVALLPTLVSAGLMHGMIERIASEQIGGRTEIGSVDVGWFGHQRVQDVVIHDARDGEVATVDATIEAGLLALILGSADPLPIALSGDVTIERREDGTINVLDLVSEEEKTEPAPMPHLVIEMDKVAIDFNDRPNDLTIEIDGLTGSFDGGAGHPLSLNLTGKTRSGDMSGDLNVRAGIDGLMAASGDLTPSGATSRIEASVTSIPIPFVAGESYLESLTINVTSDDLSSSITMGIGGSGVVGDAEPSRIDGNLVMSPGLTPDGTIAFALDALTGYLTAERLPVGVLQPMLDQRELPIDLARDVGELADVNVRLADGDTSMSVTAKSDNLDLMVRGVIEKGMLKGEALTLTTSAHPDLIAGYVPFVTERAVPIELAFDSFGCNAEDPADLAAWFARGRLSVTDRIILRAPDADPAASALDIETFALEVDTPSIAERVVIRGGGKVNGGTLTIEQTLTGLMDDTGLRLDAVVANGRIAVTGLAPDALAPWAPEHVEMVRTIFGNAMEIAVDTSGAADGLMLAGRVTGGSSTVTFDGTRVESTLDVANATAELAISAATIAALEDAPADAAPRLEAPAVLRLDLDPMAIALAGEDGALPKTIAGTMRIDDLLSRPSTALTEPVRIRDLAIPFTLGTRDAWSLVADISGAVRRGNSGDDLGVLSGRIDLHGLTAERSGVVSLGLTNLVARRVADLLGQDTSALTDLSDTPGSITLEARAQGKRWTTSLIADLPQLAGRFDASVDDDVLELSAPQARATLPAAFVQRLLTSAPEEGQPASPGPPVTDDVSVTLDVRRAALPLGMFGDDPIDPTQFKLDATVRGGPLRLATEDGTVAVDTFGVELTSDDLAKGIAFALDGTSSGAGRTGTIDMNGTLSSLVGKPEPVVDLGAGRIAATGTVTDAPTALLDTLLDFHGMLVAAVGETMNANIDAQRFSSSSGNFTTRIETPNGWLEAKLRGREQSYRIPAKTPVEAELTLTKAFREQLLARIHPVLADIRATEQPIRLSVKSAILPIGATDLSGMKADIDITIGAVEFDGGSLLLGFLRLAGGTRESTFAGEIEPIQAKIRNGIVTYDRFVVRIEKYTLAYQGQIDLVQRTINLRTEVPLESLESLGGNIRELSSLPAGVSIPIVTRGSFDNHKTQIDPDFNFAKESIDGAIRSGLEDLFGGGKDK